MRLAFAAIACLIALSPLTRAQPIADSLADYSGIQGYRNWYYGYSKYTSGTLGPFQQLTLFNNNVWYRAEGGGTSYWTSIWKGGQHPNAAISTGGRLGEENWVIRRWVAPPGFLQYIHISGSVQKQSITGGDGSVFHLMVNSGNYTNIFLVSNDLTAHTFSQDICVAGGDRVDFIVDPNINDQYDSTNLVATITGPISQMPVSTSACPGAWATFNIATYASVPLQWQFEYAPNDWRLFTGNPQTLPCGGIIQAQRPFNTNTLTVKRTGCPGTPAVRIRCRLNVCNQPLSDIASLSVCAADFNCDGIVDDADFQVFLTSYNLLVCSDPAMPQSCAADLNGDNFADDADFQRFVVAYNELVCS
ncbi:MAG: hypothetical protein JNM86_08685 [Phycisphaerae bacterium]|nr:hypothetical protein [Phycisphaerae bacterium]